MDKPVKPGLGMMLSAIVCPPLYFAIRRRFVASAVYSVLYVIAVPLLLIGVGVFFWIPGCVHAVWDHAHVKQEQLIQRQASVMAERLAERRVL
jgi:hypothetical protein